MRRLRDALPELLIKRDTTWGLLLLFAISIYFCRTPLNSSGAAISPLTIHFGVGLDQRTLDTGISIFKICSKGGTIGMVPAS